MIETYDIDEDAVKDELQTLMEDELADWEDDYGTHPLHSPHNPDRSHRIYVSRGKRVHQSIFLQ